MTDYEMSPLYLVDFYKFGHVRQYAKGITCIYDNWTPRSSRTDQKSVRLFGTQYFTKEILQNEWGKNFFDRPLGDLLSEYREMVAATLGDLDPPTKHIKDLWNLAYMPIDIWTIPEGDQVPIRVPMAVMANTVDHAFWLPNYLETIWSNIMWKPCTSATTAAAYRKVCEKWAREFGETNLSFIDWQCHDFSFRGMAGREDAWLSGMGHLLSFSGTDTIPAIFKAKQYYHAEYSCGGSVNATEHSVMCAGLEDGEFDTFKRLITETYPKGILSIVSDTWDLWRVITEHVPRLKEVILAREGKIVIRPDSGEPNLILCGNPAATGPARKGVLQLLAEFMGTDGKGHINKMGAIYGDKITVQEADTILGRTVQELKLSPFNCVLGVGSYTYEYVTRDTYGFAVKATAVKKDGKILDIFKKPITDDGTKNSLKGIPCVFLDDEGEYFVRDGQQPETLNACAFRKVYSDGKILIDENFGTIRQRVRA